MKDGGLESWVVVKNHVGACALSWRTCPKQQATPLCTLGSFSFIYPILLECFYEIVLWSLHFGCLNLFVLSSLATNLAPKMPHIRILCCGICAIEVLVLTNNIRRRAQKFSGEVSALFKNFLNNGSFCTSSPCFLEGCGPRN